MKKLLNQSLIFAIYGLFMGAFYREFSKFKGYTQRTMLGMAHPHILVLGLAWFLLMAILVKVFVVDENSKSLGRANCIYTIGIVVSTVMMAVRGILEVTGFEFTSSTNGMISGIAGLGHIATAVGMVMFINVFRKACK